MVTDVRHGVAQEKAMEAEQLNLPYLEPLSKATETTLAPLKLYPSDYLEIDLDDEGRRFLVKFRRKNRKGEFDDFASHWARELLHRIPERRAGKSNDPHRYRGRWILAGTDFTALVIQHAWPEKQIVWADPNAKALYEFLITRFHLQGMNARKAADFKKHNKVPELPNEYIKHPNPDLRLAPYQETVVGISTFQESYAQFMKQGTGKTPIVIARICAEARYIRKTENRMYRALLIVPRQTRTNWEREFARFTTVPGQTVVVRGWKAERIRDVTDAITEEPSVDFSACICSYHSAMGTKEALKMVPWDIIVLDESHHIKSPYTKRWKFFRDFRHKGAKRVVMTGSPIANTVMDLWTQLEFLGDGLSGFQDFDNFRRFHGEWERNRDGREMLAGLQNIPLLQERLARLSFQITKKEAGLSLPDKVRGIVEVYMTKKQTDLYTELLNSIIVSIEEEEAEGKTLTADNILTRLLRLSQITSGFVTWDAKFDFDGVMIRDKKVEQINPSGKNPKINQLVEILKEDRVDDPNGKKLVWAYWVEDIRAITERLTQENIKYVAYHPAAAERVKDAETASEVYNNSDAWVFVGNPASAAEGLNLLGYDYRAPEDQQAPTYTDHEIFFSQSWSATQREQAEDRAHRRGTRSNVRITDLQVPYTIDHEIRERVTMKREMAMMIQDVRAVLNRMASTSYKGAEL